MFDKKLGFGMMRLPLKDKNVADSIDIELTKKMVDSFIENGFTYFDTAWMYCGFKSEDAVKEALTSRHKRDTYTLATKLHASFLKEKSDRDRIFDEQIRKTGVDFFDYYLIHDLGVKHYEIYNELDCFEWILDKKRKGIVKEIGFSFHDRADLLERVLTEHPEFDFVQLQINYLDWENPEVQSRLCYETALKHNKRIVIMQPVKGGALANVPYAVENMFKEKLPDMSVASWAIRFAAGLKNVSMVLSGMSNMEQLQDNMSFMKDFKPLSEDEISMVMDAAKIIGGNKTIECTGCSYCTNGCPKNIPIPKYFSLYNTDKIEGSGRVFSTNANYYMNLAESFGRAKDCISCGQCESICPQHLPIIKHLTEVSKLFDD